MIILALWSIFLGAGLVESPHYKTCKAIKFESPACALELKLSKLEPKK